MLIRSPSCVIASSHKTHPWAMCSSAFFSLPSLLHSQYILSYSLRPNQRRSPHIRLPNTIHTAFFSCVSQPASISSHTPFLSSPTSPHYSKSILPYSLRPNWRQSPHIRFPPTIHQSSSRVCPNRRQSPHIRLPNTIHHDSLLLVCVPTGVNLLTYTLPLLSHLSKKLGS